MLLSSMAAFLLYAAMGLSLLAVGLLRPEELGRHGGPIKVRLGSPEGLDDTTLALPRAGNAEPAMMAEAPTQASPPAPSRQAPPQPQNKAQSAAAIPPPKATAAAQKSVPLPSAPALPTPSSQAAPGPAVSPPLAAGEGLPSAAASSQAGLSIKGSEQGNAFETSYESGNGKIGRSLYVPIYLFMPIPAMVAKTIYDSIPPSKDGLRTAEIRKMEFRSWYEPSGDSWRLKKDPPPDQRPALWLMLRDSGYPLAKAEYKTGKALRPVVLTFKVGAPDASGTPSLLEVAVVSSSGYKELDDAVVFGFEQAAFFNDSPAVVTGRFTYRFDE